MIKEGVLLIEAGNHTIGWVLTVGFAVFLRKKLYFLATLLPQLDKMLYLTAALKDVLRLSYGVCGRLPRSALDEVLSY